MQFRYVGVGQSFRLDSTTIRRRPRHLDVALRFCLQFIKLLAGKSTQGRLCMRHEKFSEAIDSQVD